MRFACGKARVEHTVHVTGATVRDFLTRHADKRSRLHTDESKLYPTAGKEFASHETVNHAGKEYARGDVTINTAEGFFGVFKRGITGVYQHCSEHHFPRYLDEFEFRFNNRSRLGVEDVRRAVLATQGGEGKRLTWRRSGIER